MAFDSKRHYFFDRIKRVSDSYITTIDTEYGKVDVLGRYNCRWCYWELRALSQEHDKFFAWFNYYSVDTPKDNDLFERVNSAMGKYVNGI